MTTWHPHLTACVWIIVHDGQSEAPLCFPQSSYPHEPIDVSALAVDTLSITLPGNTNDGNTNLREASTDPDG